MFFNRLIRDYFFESKLGPYQVTFTLEKNVSHENFVEIIGALTKERIMKLAAVYVIFVKLSLFLIFACR
jgi:hypothetical protein